MTSAEPRPAVGGCDRGTDVGEVNVETDVAVVTTPPGGWVQRSGLGCTARACGSHSPDVDVEGGWRRELGRLLGHRRLLGRQRGTPPALIPTDARRSPTCHADSGISRQRLALPGINPCRGGRSCQCQLGASGAKR